MSGKGPRGPAVEPAIAGQEGSSFGRISWKRLSGAERRGFVRLRSWFIPTICKIECVADKLAGV